MGTVEADGVVFEYLEAGSGPLALCLHGFPDSAYTWRHLLPRLADAGYHAVAPFQRGYAPTSLAADGVYQTGALSADANALHELLGGDGDAMIIGHDWGAPATYGAAIGAPERWRRVVGMSVPPGDGLMSAILTYGQLKMSWYMFFILHPLADFVVANNDLEFIDRLWADWSPGFDATDELEAVKQTMRDPAHLAAALGYYRASLASGPRDPAFETIQANNTNPISQPILYLHGATDGCIGLDVARTAAGAFTNDRSRLAIVEGAGHFLQLEQPERVNQLIIDFLAG
jgi:pimeloyl-ACP methyl ester carboxylesterase